MLKIARQAKEESSRKRSKKSTTHALTSVQIPRIKESILDYVYIESNSDSDSSAEDVDK